MKYILFVLLTCLTVLGQRTPFSVNGVVVANANLTNTATITWTLNGSDIIGTGASGGIVGTIVNPSPGSAVTGGIFTSPNATGTNGSPQRVTIVDGTNLLSGTLFATNKVTSGSGDELFINDPNTAQRLLVIKGATASGDTNANPIAKVSRYVNLNGTASAGDGAELGSAFVGIAATEDGENNNGIQTVGVFGGSYSVSTNAVHTGGRDAVGLYGIGTAYGGGVGRGGFMTAYTFASSNRANAVELQVNNSGAAGTYNSSGFSDTSGMWMNATGLFDSSAGMVIGNPFGYQFDVGLGFNGQVVGGKTGGVKTTSIRDDGNAVTSLDIRGSHATGINLANGTFSGSAINASGKTVQAGTLAVGANASVVGTLSVTDQITNAALSAATVVYASATKVLSSIAPGNSGDVLTSAGDGVAPSFSAPFAGTANTVVGSGTTAANDIAVFTDTTHTNIARSTSAGNLGNSSSATYTLNIGLSGPTDPQLLFANASTTLNVPLLASDGTSSLPGLSFASDPDSGFYRSGAGILNITIDTSRSVIFTSSQLSMKSDHLFGWYSSGFAAFDTSLSRDSAGVVKITTSSSSTLGGLKASALTLTPAAADTTALTVNGSVTGSATGPTELHNTTFNSSGVVIHDRTVITNTASAATSKFKTWETSAGGVLASVQIDGLVSTVAGLSSSVSTTPIAITATGVTNTFGKLAQALFDGVGLTFTVYNGAGTPIYTNTAALAGGCAILQANGKIIITGTGAVGTLSPL